jgi:hypothetical protein
MDGDVHCREDFAGAEPLSEMVERVARAMANSCSYAAATDFWRAKAREAIEAMREPTREMVSRGGALAQTTWHVMIDAALREDKS